MAQPTVRWRHDENSEVRIERGLTTGSLRAEHNHFINRVDSRVGGYVETFAGEPQNAEGNDVAPTYTHPDSHAATVKAERPN